MGVSWEDEDSPLRLRELIGILGVCKGDGDFPTLVTIGVTAGSIFGEVTILALLGGVLRDDLETSEDDRRRASGEC